MTASTALYTQILHTLSHALRGEETAQTAATQTILQNDLIQENGVPVTARLFIHQNHLSMTAKEALRATFSTVTRLVDLGFFDFIAHDYVTTHPPTDPRISHYGADFADHIRQHPNCTTVPFLADVAALDWAMNKVSHQYDLPPLEPNDIAQVAVEDQARMIFGFRPVIEVLQTHCPVSGIYAFAMGQAEAPDNMQEPQIILIQRENGHPVFELLDTAYGTFLRHLFAGGTLSDAATAGYEAHPDFDLSTALAHTINTQLLSSVHVQ